MHFELCAIIYSDRKLAQSVSNDLDKRFKFSFISVEVFSRQHVKRDNWDVKFSYPMKELVNLFRSSLVAVCRGGSGLFGPPTVAIQYHSNVAWKLGTKKTTCEPTLIIPVNDVWRSHCSERKRCHRLGRPSVRGQCRVLALLVLAYPDSQDIFCVKALFG